LLMMTNNKIRVNPRKSVVNVTPILAEGKSNSPLLSRPTGHERTPQVAIRQ
jgi:hypothetical protein